MLSDVAEHLTTQGCLYWVGGDFQVEDDALAELDWFQAIKGKVRTADKRIGTCTSACPATTIDYHAVHEKLEHMVQEGHVDLVSRLSPHRPVWALLELAGGEKFQYNTC